MQIRIRVPKRSQCVRRGLAAYLMTFLIGSAADAALVHRYRFDEAGGTNVTDSVGTAHGNLINGSGNATLSGGILTLGNNGVTGSGDPGVDYVDLPNGIISALSPSASFEAWVVWQGGNDWQRIWDYGISEGGEDVSSGSGNVYYTFVCPRSGGGVLLSEIASPNGLADQQIGWTGPMAMNTPVHMAVTLDESLLGFTFYLDGRAINFTTMQDFRLNLLNDVNNWLGRSQWPDAGFNGTYDEVRIYDHPMSAAEVLESFLAGPNAVGTVDLGAPVAAHLIGPAELIVEGSFNYALEADYATESGVVVYADASVSYSSSDTNVATISANGEVEALAIGTTTLEVTFGGLTDSILLEVLPVPLPPPEIQHRWSFNSPASGVLEPGVESDLVGTAHGDIWGGAFQGPSDLNNPGTLYLDHSVPGGAYVDLPNGIISARTNITVELWVTPNDFGENWQRFWDFGTTDWVDGIGGEILPGDGIPAAGGLDYFMLTARVVDGNTSRLQTNPPGGDEGAPSAARVETAWNSVTRGVEHHLVAVYNAAADKMSLYMNGLLVGTDSSATMELADLPDVNNWIGRSNWQADGFINAYYNEMRIYEGVLLPLQIAINSAAGPDTFIGDPGSMTSLTIEVPTNDLQYLGMAVDANVLANFAAISGVPVDSMDGVEWASADTNVVTVSDTGLITPIRVGSTLVSVSFDGSTADTTMNVAELVVAPTLAHRYSFSETSGTNVLDSVGVAHGVIDGTGAVFDGSELNLPGGPPNGTDAYVDLPNNMISTLGDQITLELWTTWDGSGNWGRVYSFGDSVGGEGVSDTGLDWLDLITQAGDNGLLSADVAIDGAGTARLIGPTALPQGVETHVAFVIDVISGINRLYLNGQWITSAAIENAWSVTGLNDINNWLGRGQWGDQRYLGSFNEFRIYTGLLSEAEVALSFARGPDNLTGAITVPIEATLSGGVISITWPTSTPATLQSSTDLTEPSAWSDVGGSPVETNGMFQQDVPAVQDAEAFRLTD